MSSKVNTPYVRDVPAHINTNDSLTGREIKDWIEANGAAAGDSVPADIRRLADTLYYKYVAPRSQTGTVERHLHDDAYYFVRKKQQDDSCYIIRDQLKSPRKIPEHLMKLSMCDSGESYKGSMIAEWAYAQHEKADNPYFLDGLDIITKYLQSSHPINKDCYYFVQASKRGVVLRRDTDKSPRMTKQDGDSNE